MRQQLLTSSRPAPRSVADLEDADAVARPVVPIVDQREVGGERAVEAGEHFRLIVEADGEEAERQQREEDRAERLEEEVELLDDAEPVFAASGRTDYGDRLWSTAGPGPGRTVTGDGGGECTYAILDPGTAVEWGARCTRSSTSIGAPLTADG